MNETHQIKVNKMLIAVAEIKEYMRDHGIFRMVQYKSGTFRVFPAYCDCKGSKVSGLLFYKWGPRTSRHKKNFDRLIFHVVCYKCGIKGPIEVFDPADYDPDIRDNNLWKRFEIKAEHLPK